MMTQEKLTPYGDLPPGLSLFLMITGHYLSRAIYVAAKLGIADSLADGPQHYETVAKACGAHPVSLYRLMRLLSSAGILAEPEDGQFELTAAGQLLRSGVPGSARSAALLWAGPPLTDGWNKLLYSVQTGETAFDHVFGMNVFPYMAQHPEEAAYFYDGMTIGAEEISAAVAATYDFSQFGTIFDVGGGPGTLITAILRRYPSPRGVLFDLPHVVENTRKRIETAGLNDRCGFIAGDFAQEVPKGGDAYVLKHVIHDWEDKRSVAILTNCRRAMTREAKLILVEAIAPARVDASIPNLLIMGNDVNMLVNTGGSERTEAEFSKLFEAAGLRLNRVVQTQALVSVLEAVCA